MTYMLLHQLHQSVLPMGKNHLGQLVPNSSEIVQLNVIGHWVFIDVDMLVHIIHNLNKKIVFPVLNCRFS